MNNVINLPSPRKWESSPDRPTPPRRKPNAELRTREHLTPAEVESLIASARKLDLLTTPYVFSDDDAIAMTEAEPW